MNLDRAYRLALRIAFPLAQLYWWLFRIEVQGAFVRVWHDGRLLVVRHSYKRGLALPGGGRRRGESDRLAAMRELREEVGIEVDPRELARLGAFQFRGGGTNTRLVVFDWSPREEPVTHIDRREIVWAGFMQPEKLRSEILWRPMHALLEEEVALPEVAASPS